MIPGLGKSPGEGKATYSSILAWRITWTIYIVHGVAKSLTQLRDFHFTSLYSSYFNLLCVCVCVCAHVLDAQSCPTLCKPMDCSPPGSSVHGISQARLQEWVGIPFSRRSSQLRDRTPGLLHCRQILYHLSHQGSP